jgi:hypothetical protein
MTSSKLHLTLVAYGSCVRGDARERSDLDLLAVIDPGGPPLPPPHHPRTQEVDTAHGALAEALQNLAAEVNLGAPRPIDLKVASAGELSAVLPSRLFHAIRAEGVSIFVSDPVAGWWEAGRDG